VFPQAETSDCKGRTPSQTVRQTIQVSRYTPRDISRRHKCNSPQFLCEEEFDFCWGRLICRHKGGCLSTAMHATLLLCRTTGPRPTTMGRTSISTASYVDCHMASAVISARQNPWQALWFRLSKCTERVPAVKPRSKTPRAHDSRASLRLGSLKA